jgi:hypothetical protein
MPEESHLEEMSAAIRAQRERQGAPRSMISSEDARPAAVPVNAPERPPAEQPETPVALRRGLLARLRGR